MVTIKGLRGPGGEFGALGVVDVAGSPADVWRFVADVEQQPQWNQGVKQSRILETKGNRKSVHQVVGWNFLALRGDMHLRLSQEEDPRALTISTEMVDGTMMRAFRSRVGVRQKSPGVCELQMEMFMAPAIFVPFGIRSMVGGQVRRQLRGVLASLQERLEERAASNGGARAAGAGAGFASGGAGGDLLWRFGGLQLPPLPRLAVQPLQLPPMPQWRPPQLMALPPAVPVAALNAAARQAPQRAAARQAAPAPPAPLPRASFAQQQQQLAQQQPWWTFVSIVDAA